ncbi:MAG: hypothetical protein ABDH28_04040 [Brevinematia bacterium]
MKRYSIRSVDFSSFEELFDFINRNSIELSESEIREIEELLVKEDETGKWCLLFAEKLKDRIDVKKLEEAVIEKDKTGQLCFVFAKAIPEADVEKLRKAIYEKDTTGVWKLKIDELKIRGK